AAATLDDTIAVMHHPRIRAVRQQQAHHRRSAEPRREPERRRADQLGAEMVIPRRSARRRPAGDAEVRIGAVRDERAHHRLVAPRALTSAPFAISGSTTAACPARAAAITGVSPSSSAAFGFAPAWSSRFTIAWLPFRLAFHSGVTPRSVAAFTRAPALISRSAV